MRSRWLTTTMVMLIGTVMLTGCNSNLKEENALLTEENEDLRAQLADRNDALETAHDELRTKDLRLAELRAELDDASRMPTLAANDPFSAIPGVQGSVSAGEVTATVESDVLFDAGKASLKSTAKRSLDEVARILRSDYGTKTIRVAGHTDTDPIRKSGYKSNYHLGFERAFAVREYLVSRGVAPDQVYVASHGPDRAIGTKAESRRVEIAVVLND